MPRVVPRLHEDPVDLMIEDFGVAIEWLLK
jgi:hypothetical protein